MAGDGGDPHVHLRRLRGYLSRRKGDAIMLGEVNVPSKDLATFFGGGDGDELHLSFCFPVMQAIWLSLAREDAAPVVHALANGLPDLPLTGQVAQFLRNHDELTLDQLTPSEAQEVFAAFAPDKDMQLYGHGIRRRLAPLLGGDEAKLRCVQSLLFSLPGTPTLFYGDEYGQGDDLSLPDRLSVRTPMQWSSRVNGGFSTAAPEDLVRPATAQRPISATCSAMFPCSAGILSRCSTGLSGSSVPDGRRRRSAGAPARVIPTTAGSVIAHRLDWESGTLVAVHNLSDRKAARSTCRWTTSARTRSARRFSATAPTTRRCRHRSR